MVVILVPTTLLCYTRLAREDLLSHDLRRRMLDALRERPGLSVGELATAFSVDFKTAQHHARMLSRAGRLVLQREGRRLRCYLPGAARPDPAAREEGRLRGALAAIVGGAGTPARLARALGIPRGTAGSLLLALARRGLVVRDGPAYRPPR